jgi:Protein phosphatase 2C
VCYMRVSLATIPANPGRENEDFSAATADTVVLLDGAGTPAGSESGCIHGVAWFARQLGARILAEAADAERSLSLCLRNAIYGVREMHEDTCDLDHSGTPSATVIIARLADEFEYLVLADSVLLLDIADSVPVVVTDSREAQVGRPYRKAMDALPSGSPEHAVALREYVETLRSHRNVADGFWVADTNPSAADHAVTGTHPLDGLRAVALLSDGASRLTDRFHLTDWVGTLTILRDQGPQSLIERVREAERSDPDGSRWPRGKAYDDATAAYAPIAPQ